MGKYMRKPKLPQHTMTAIDNSPSSLGVRTRARTLALQKLQSSKLPTAQTSAPPAEGNPEPAYLQLRSRRLEKPVEKGVTVGRRRNPNPSFVNSSCGGGLVGSGEKERLIEGGGGAEEGCVGENWVDFDGRERSTPELTPGSLIKNVDVINTPGSSTRSRTLEASNRISNSSTARCMPSMLEIEEFFAFHEQQQHRRFADKYNFDFCNESPLEGCYEWVKI